MVQFMIFLVQCVFFQSDNHYQSLLPAYQIQIYSLVYFGQMFENKMLVQVHLQDLKFALGRVDYGEGQ